MDFEKLSNFKNASLCYKIFGKDLSEGQVLNSQEEVIKEMSQEDRDKFKKFA